MIDTQLMTHISVFIAIFVPALIALCLWGRNWYRKQMTAHEAMCIHVNKLDERIKALSPEEMTKTAEQLLADPEKFECVAATTPPNEKVKNLGPELQSIFTRFETITHREYNAIFSRHQIQAHTVSWQETPWWQIGTDGKNMILAAPNENGIYVSSSGKLPEKSTPQYQSIYEWIAWKSMD